MTELVTNSPPVEPDDPLDRFHWHEALDRTNIMLDLFVSQVEQHPVVKRTPELKALAFEAADKMAQLYQKIGENDPYWQDEA